MGRQGSAPAQADTESGPCALIYFRKSRTQLLDSLNIALSKWETSLDSAVYNQQTLSHPGRRDALYSVRKSALSGVGGRGKGAEQGDRPCAGARCPLETQQQVGARGPPPAEQASFRQSRKKQCPKGKTKRNL